MLHCTPPPATHFAWDCGVAPLTLTILATCRSTYAATTDAHAVCIANHSLPPRMHFPLYSPAAANVHCALVTASTGHKVVFVWCSQVVIEEMLHMTTAANLLNAVGGAPSIDQPAFIPSWPLEIPLINQVLSPPPQHSFLPSASSSHTDSQILPLLSFQDLFLSR